VVVVVMVVSTDAGGYRLEEHLSTHTGCARSGASTSWQVVGKGGGCCQVPTGVAWRPSGSTRH
jgi:hypothetical protein